MMRIGSVGITSRSLVIRDQSGKIGDFDKTATTRQTEFLNPRGLIGMSKVCKLSKICAIIQE
jgi:hypothetical protein